MIPCPSPEILDRLDTGSIGGETFVELEAHIETCGQCQSNLQQRARKPLPGQDHVSSALHSPDANFPPALPGFKIIRELGRGGTGVVYLAHDERLGREVALKIVRGGPTAGPRELRQWLSEARAFRAVRHPHIVTIHDARETDEWRFLVLEYIAGGALTDRLAEPITPRDAASLLEAIARAVAAVHRVGQLHLDLKPSNILIDAGPDDSEWFERIRVTDFGLSYFWDDPELSLPSINGPVGTPSYMSPQQASGNRLALARTSDVYGLGAIFYHVLTGRPPFASQSVLETLRQVRETEPVPPRRRNPAVPRDLETICLACLQKSPERRYQSAEAVADDLEALAARSADPSPGCLSVRANLAALPPSAGSGLAGRFPDRERHREHRRVTCTVAARRGRADACGDAVGASGGGADACGGGAHAHRQSASAKRRQHLRSREQCPQPFVLPGT